MKTIIDLILLTSVTVFVVDLSGFTDTWLSFLSHYKGKRIVELKPFSCSLCMTWWVGLAYLLITGHFTLPFIALVALLSFLTSPIAQLLTFVREGLNKIINLLLSVL